MAKLILGIVGEMGSGKGVIADHVVKNFNAGSHKFSQILRDILDRVYVEQSRESISTLSLILRKNFGETVLAKSMFNDVQTDEHDIVVIDGVRRIEDIVYLKELPEFKLVFVDANIETRYQRLVARGENKGDEDKTIEQFKRDHEADADARIADMKKDADLVIENNGTYEELYKQIDEIVKQNI